jgi:hypothetical protein
MFTCTRCGEEKPDSERGSVGWWAKISLLLIGLLSVSWLSGAWASPLCKDCSWGYRFIGIVCLTFLGLVAFIIVLLKYAPVLKY